MGNVCESLCRAPDNGASGPAPDRTNQGISALILRYNLHVLFLFKQAIEVLEIKYVNIFRFGYESYLRLVLVLTDW